jgi:hypothetical protein
VRYRGALSTRPLAMLRPNLRCFGRLTQAEKQQAILQHATCLRQQTTHKRPLRCVKGSGPTLASRFRLRTSSKISAKCGKTSSEKLHDSTWSTVNSRNRLVVAEGGSSHRTMTRQRRAMNQPRTAPISTRPLGSGALLLRAMLSILPPNTGSEGFESRISMRRSPVPSPV